MDGNAQFEDRAMNGATFRNCAMARSRFDDVTLAEAVFWNVDLRGTRLSDVNLSGAAIDDANIAGLTIAGHDVAALIRDREAALAAEGEGEGGGARLLSAEPQLFVADIEVACRFYVEKLGFGIAFSYGEPAFYAQVLRDGCRLNLRRVDGAVLDAGFREREADALAATVTLEDAAPLFAEFERAGVAFHQPLRAEPWGARTFIVADVDGNLVAFAGRDGGD